MKNRVCIVVSSFVVSVACVMVQAHEDGIEVSQCATECEPRSSVTLDQQSGWSQDQFARAGGVCEGCAIEVHVIVDKALFDIHGSGTQAYVDDLIEGINENWSKPFSQGGMGLDVVLTETTIFFGADPWPETTEIFALFDEVTDFVDENMPTNPDGRDTVLFLTGLDLDDSRLGVASLGTMTRSRSVAIAKVSSMSLEAAAANACHQLGHNAGARHDGVGDHEECSISENFMGAISIFNPPTSFSHCSMEDMFQYMISPSFDVLAGLAHGSSVCDADLNGDGVLNFFDVSAFMLSFGSGCP